MLHGRVAHDAFEDAMELRVAAEARFESGVEHGLALAGSVYLDEALDPLAVAEIDESKSGLLFEETA